MQDMVGSGVTWMKNMPSMITVSGVILMVSYYIQFFAYCTILSTRTHGITETGPSRLSVSVMPSLLAVYSDISGLFFRWQMILSFVKWQGVFKLDAGMC